MRSPRVNAGRVRSRLHGAGLLLGACATAVPASSAPSGRRSGPPLPVRPRGRGAASVPIPRGRARARWRTSRMRRRSSLFRAARPGGRSRAGPVRGRDPPGAPPAALDRLSLDDRRLRRPGRRLDRRGDPAGARLGPLARAGRRRGGRAGSRSAGGRTRPSRCSGLAGIYGAGPPGPSPSWRAGTARRVVKPGQVFNRIHVEDIAGALCASRRPCARRHIQRHRRPAGAAAGCRGLCRRSHGLDAATGDTVRNGAIVAHGALVLRREQAGLERRDPKARLRFRFPDYRTALDAMWSTAAGKATKPTGAAQSARNRGIRPSTLSC